MGDNPSWRKGLLRASERPEKQLYSDDLIVILADHAPKGRFHYLVLPKAPIDTVEDLTPSHIPLLRYMMAKSEKFIEREIRPKTRCDVLMGFHIVPTFIRLHLHLISNDFDAPGMKSTYAWGSFTTDFFMHPEKAISILESKGRIEIDPVEACEVRGDNSSILSCHGCKEKFSDLAELKSHIRIHDKDNIYNIKNETGPIS
ncbi:putative Aprataxin [Hypsibius exemplaris]|uniref:Aprataxin n=1 Tax=Hypsibius exemplaris TaxID=2072580 RepID=A0A1W0WA88_HYPEX|nr:putative Aprataxin [Hypsibius exemplaris]